MSNVKISELAEATTPTTDDLVMIVDDPSGTPISKKSTLANLLGVALTAIRAVTASSNKIPYFTSGSAAGVLDVTEQTVAGRLTGGNLKALSVTELTTLINAATEFLKGAVILAAPAEVIDGTDTGKAVTAAGLRSVVVDDAVDAALSGTPVILGIVDKGNNTYYFKGYPTKS